MSGLNPSALASLVANAQTLYRQDVAADHRALYRNHPTAEAILGKVREVGAQSEVFKGLRQLVGGQRNVQPAKAYGTIQSAVVDGNFDITVPVRTFWRPWPVSDIELLYLQENRPKILDLLKQKMDEVDVDWAAKQEEFLWTLPTAGDVDSPYSIPYYIVPNASTGYNGGAPSGHTTVAGVNPTTETIWKNYTFNWSAWDSTANGPLSALRTAMAKMSWVQISGLRVKDVTGNAKPRYVIFLTIETMEKLRLIMQGLNSNIGWDVLNYNPILRGAMFQDVSILESKESTLLSTGTGNSLIYMIDTHDCDNLKLKGFEGRDVKIEYPNNMPDTTLFSTPKSMQLRVAHRRNHAVGYKTA